MTPNLAAAVELKACPFCGSAGKITEKEAGGFAVLRRVECSNEDCDGTCAWYNEADAITAWNTRPPVAGLSVDGTELFKALKKVHDADGTYDDMDKAAREFLGKVDG